MSNINPVTEASVEATPLPPQPAVTNPVGTAAPILPVEDKPLKSCGIYRKMSKHGTFRKNGAYFFGRSFLNG